MRSVDVVVAARTEHCGSVNHLSMSWGISAGAVGRDYLCRFVIVVSLHRSSIPQPSPGFRGCRARVFSVLCIFLLLTFSPA